MIDDGIYPPRDANKIAFELWTVVHGVAALFIAKPCWLLDDVDELTDKFFAPCAVAKSLLA